MKKKSKCLLDEVKFIKLRSCVKLSQGLAVNKNNQHLICNEKTPDFNYPLLRIADMISNKFERYISTNINRNLISNKNDIIYTRTGQIGLVFRGFSGVLHNNCFKVSLIDPNINKDFLHTILKSEFVRKQALSFALSSVQPDLTHEMFKEIRVPYFPYQIQEKIAKIINYIEKKIEINNKINDNLSNMAKDIYMYYFFKKSPNGKLNDIIFESDKSKVQVGDAKNCIGKYPFFTSGVSILTWSEYFVDGRYCFLNTGGNADVKFYVGKSAYSTDTWCIYTNNNMTDYLYLLLSTLKEELNKKYFQGTGLKHLQKDILRNKDIYIPTEIELYNFNNIIKPLFDSISKNTREIKKLVGLRDFLLPLLMNGQATIE